jgi:hypothetical protein
VFLDNPGRREAAGRFHWVSVVNNKPQIGADDFSILQFIGSNLVFAASHPASIKSAATKLAEVAIEAVSFLSASRGNIADANGDALSIPRTPVQARFLAQSK